MRLETVPRGKYRSNNQLAVNHYSKPIYHFYVDFCKDLLVTYAFVVPARRFARGLCRLSVCLLQVGVLQCTNKT